MNVSKVLVPCAAFAVLAVSLLAVAPDARAGTTRRAINGPALSDAPEGIGCYWYRQRMTCSRYCYIEVDGHRFCREHTHGAHSQAPPSDQPIILSPMK